MADKTYDAIVVGGGHQGTIIACYLQHAGMQTVVFERQHELGGGACGEAASLARVFSRIPALISQDSTVTPRMRISNLRDKGLVYVYPDHSEGMIYDDGVSFLGYTAWKVVDVNTGRAEFNEENAQKTIDQIARFSQERRGHCLRLLGDVPEEVASRLPRMEIQPADTVGCPGRV